MISINQKWIDEVSRKENDEFVATGPTVVGFNEVDIDGVFRHFCRSPAALEIERRQWFPATCDSSARKEHLANSIKEFIFGDRPLFASTPMFRTSKSISGDGLNRQIATFTWLLFSSSLALKQQLGEFDDQCLGFESVSALVRLSANEDGPLLASEWLKNAGIAFVINSSLPSMRLDGSCSYLSNGKPVIAMTLRYDRIDNFWFTLLHELGHLKLHLAKDKNYVFLDDLENLPNEDEREAEANAFARDCLIPRDKWRRSEAFRLRTKNSILKLAQNLQINPAIVAGRLHHETGNYTLHPDLLGQDTVREQLVKEVG